MNYPAPHSPNGPWQQHHGLSAPKRNIGMLVGGAILLVIALGVGGLFLWNLHTYLTIENKFGSDPLLQGKGTGWVVEMVKAASLRRMTIFGSVSAVLGLAGLVLGGLGLRKR